jgi:hypothetical protein
LPGTNFEGNLVQGLLCAVCFGNAIYKNRHVM